MTDALRRQIDGLYRDERPQVLATLIRLVGDFDLAEDATQEAFSAALKQWPIEGAPANPRAWLITTARFKAIDTIRRKSKAAEILQNLALQQESWNDEEVQDDTLRLIFTCCHPALPEEGRVALTLREVCGLTTEEIAKCFLSAPTTIAQRIVRAKAKIREHQLPYELPSLDELGERLDSVLHVIYLVFSEGYYASSGYSLLRTSLTEEAIRLGRLVLRLLADPEVRGLLALMLLQESRRSTRVDAQGDLILLADQDRSKWNRKMIEEGAELAEASGMTGPYGIQSAIAAVHAQAPSSETTDWAKIVVLYDRLVSITCSPIVELNRAVAVAMRDDPSDGLALIDDLMERGHLTDYGLAHSARADLLRRMNRIKDAIGSYRQAAALASQDAERRFIERRISELTAI